MVLALNKYMLTFSKYLVRTIQTSIYGNLVHFYYYNSYSRRFQRSSELGQAAKWGNALPTRTLPLAIVCAQLEVSPSLPLQTKCNYF